MLNLTQVQYLNELLDGGYFPVFFTQMADPPSPTTVCSFERKYPPTHHNSHHITAPAEQQLATSSPLLIKLAHHETQPQTEK